MDVAVAPSGKDDVQAWERYNFARFYTPAKKKYNGYEELERRGKSSEALRAQFQTVEFDKVLPTYTWNQDIIGYPSAICTCYRVEHVVAVVNFARAHCKPVGIELAVTSGRHSRAAMADNCIVLDLSGMKDCEMLRDDVLRVGGGAQLHEVDLACNRAGTCVPLGGCPTTGMGLVLMGGYGHMSRKFGLSIDSLLEVTLVTSGGEVLVCNRSQNAELLWANKGGAGNFGVVVEMKLQTYKMSFYKDVGGGSGTRVLFQQRVVAPVEKLGFVGRKDILVNMHMHRMKADDGFFATSSDCKVGVSHAIVVAGGPVITWQVWTGDSVEEGKRYFKEIDKQLPAVVLAGSVNMVDYHSDLQFRYFPFSKSASAYLTEVWFEEMNERILEVIADCFTGATIRQQPFYGDMNWKSGQEPVCHTQYLGGRANIDGDDAFCLRRFKYWFLLIAVIDHTLPLQRYQAQKAATQQFFSWVKQRLAPFRSDGRASDDPYTGHQQNRIVQADGDSSSAVNYYTRDGSALFSLPGKMQRLQRIKAQYDPGNLFCVNFNVRPG